MVFDTDPLRGAMEAEKPPVALRIRLPVLGVPVSFETDAPIVRDAVEAALGAWRLLEHRPELVSPPAGVLPSVRLRLGRDDGGGAGEIAIASPAPGRVELNGAGVHGWADAATLTAACTISPAVLRDRSQFDELVLGSLVLNLIAHADRQPLHAAGVRRGRHTLLLHGRSGAGKSTLAYAALRSGWDVLSDDAVYLQSRPVLRVWARAARLHLPSESARWFPELADRPLVRRQNGKWKIPVEPAAAWPGALRPAEHPILCLLERGTGEPDVRSVDAAFAIRAVLLSLDAGFDVFRETIAPVLRVLVGERAWVVRTAPDPWRTLALLEQLVGA